MKSDYQTLKDIVAYVTNNADSKSSAIDELLEMGFDAYQLANVYGFDPDEIKESEVYQNSDDDLDISEYPYVLDKYSPLDSAILSRFGQISSETEFETDKEKIREAERRLAVLKASTLYSQICDDLYELETETNDNNSIVLDELCDEDTNNITKFFETGDEAYLDVYEL